MSLFLNNFEIKFFRGLDTVSLENLGRLNLLVGGNNSGKTSILEALAVFSSPLDIMSWASTGRMREAKVIGPMYDGLSTIDIIRWLFPHRYQDDIEDNFGILHLEGDGSSPVHFLRANCIPIRGIPPQSSFRPSKSEIPTEEDGWMVEINTALKGESGDLLSQGKENDYKSVKYELFRSAGFSAVRRNLGPRSPVVYLPPYAHRSEPMQLSRLSRAIIDDEKVGIVKLMRDLDPEIQGIEIITSADGNRPILAVRHSRAGLAPISVFGDGIRRALTIAIALNRVKGGMLLIDEIDAALHVSALDRFAPWLARACISSNVQLVATTHSLEAIDSIAKASQQEAPNELVAFHLNSQSDCCSPKRYSSGMLMRLVHERGLDIR